MVPGFLFAFFACLIGRHVLLGLLRILGLYVIVNLFIDGTNRNCGRCGIERIRHCRC